MVLVPRVECPGFILVYRQSSCIAGQSDSVCLHYIEYMCYVIQSQKVPTFCRFWDAKLTYDSTNAEISNLHVNNLSGDRISHFHVIGGPP